MAKRHLVKEVQNWDESKRKRVVRAKASAVSALTGSRTDHGMAKFANPLIEEEDMVSARERARESERASEKDRASERERERERERYMFSLQLSALLALGPSRAVLCAPCV